MRGDRNSLPGSEEEGPDVFNTEKSGRNISWGDKLVWFGGVA